MLSGLFNQKTNNKRLKSLLPIGQRTQEPMVAIPLPNMQDLQAPVTPQVKQMFDMIEQHRTKNPAYIPFAPGTPTFAREQFDEGTRRWGEEFSEGRNRWEQEFAEGKKRWESEFAAQEQQRRIQNALARERMAQETAGGDYDDLPDTAGERKNYYYGKVLRKYQDEMENLKAQKGRKDNWDTGGDYYWKLPAQEDVTSKLYDIEQDMINNLPTLKRMGLSTNDIKDIFRMQVIGSLGSEGEAVYGEWKKGKGIKTDISTMMKSDGLAGLYDMFILGNQ